LPCSTRAGCGWQPRWRRWTCAGWTASSRASSPTSTAPRTTRASSTRCVRRDNRVEADAHQTLARKLILKIVVTVKQVPDPNAPQGLDADNTVARDREVVLDPGDEYGIEEGLQLKEMHGGEVILVSMGPE